VGEMVVELSASDMVGRVGYKLHTMKKEEDGEVETTRMEGNSCLNRMKGKKLSQGYSHMLE
jgi:hypothetical protein